MKRFRGPKRGATTAGMALMAGSMAVACNALLGNADGDYVREDGGFSPDATDVVTTDATSPQMDAGSTEGFDAWSSIDAASGYCVSISPAPAFCADFDEPDSDGGLYGFAHASLNPGCSLTRTVTNSRSAPLALRALTTNFQSGCYLTAQVVPTSSIRIDLDVRIHALGGSLGAVDAIFALHTSNAKYVLYANQGSVFLQANKMGQAQNSDGLPAPGLDTYHHVTMVLELAAGMPPVMSGTFDATTITFGKGNTKLSASGPFEPGTSAEVRFGLPEVLVTNTGDVLIDNVVVRVQ